MDKDDKGMKKKKERWRRIIEGDYGFDDIINFQYDERQEMKKLVHEILDNFPDVWVLGKPHPEATKSTYSDLIHRDRFTLIYGDFIQNLLSITNLLIHQKCTTMLESWLKNVPALNFGVTKLNNIWKKEVDCGPHNATSVEEAIHKIPELLKESTRRKFLEEEPYSSEIEKWLGIDSNEPSTQELINKLHA
ncbi:MAG: hypothetical protein ABEH43_09720, partial [Flavobacteriales bacterium]